MLVTERRSNAGSVMARVEWSDGDLITVREPRDYQCLARHGTRLAVTRMNEPRHKLMVADFLRDPVSPILQSYERSGDYSVTVIDGDEVVWQYALPEQARLYNVSWSPDDSMLLLDMVLADRTTRVIHTVDTSTWEITELYREFSDGLVRSATTHGRVEPCRRWDSHRIRA